MLLISSSWYAIKKSPKKGRGIYAVKGIPAGTVIGDYLGTIIRSDSANEAKDGLYDMCGGTKYDILAHPKQEGIHLINHSCANNCDAYPYQGHILYFALRKIFKGEELTVNYGLGGADEKDVPCWRHACRCNSKICTGTMHENESKYEAWYAVWEKLIKREFGLWYRKAPGKYGSELLPLPAYPAKITIEDPRIYPNIFGSEKAPALHCDGTKLPTPHEIMPLIRQTGKRLFFPKFSATIYGVRDGMILTER